MQEKLKYPVKASIICLLAASFYLYEFSLQVSLGVMTHELMRDMSLNAAGIGLISAFYFYGYAPMQIPGGIMHDWFGPRRVLTFAIITCAIGAFGFYLSHTMFQACSARLLMGVGSAFSFTGALMLIARWFPPKWFAVLSGTVQLMSSIGAIGGQLPLAIAIHHWGWRNSMGKLGIIGAILALAVWLVVKDNPSNSQPLHHEKTTKQPNRLKKLFRSADSWWVASYSFVIWAPVIAFAGLWGVPFLVAAYPQLSTAHAAMLCGLLWVGIGIGSPLCGWLSESIKQRRTVLIGCAISGIIASLTIIYIHPPVLVTAFCLFLFGLGGGGQSLAFCVVRDISHPSNLGTAIGLNNMTTVAGGAILQPLIGCILYFTWHGGTHNGVPSYSLSNYQLSLLVIPICYIVAILISIFRIKETNCKQLYGTRYLATNGTHAAIK